MKQSTIEYMAGLFDAEGCFNIARAFRKSSNCYNYIAQIIFTNTNLELMKWLVSNFGGVYKKRKSISGNKQAYDWKITNQKHALTFISIIYPYLFVKKQEAEQMLKYYELNGKEDPIQRENIFNKMKDLKWNKSSVTTEVQDASNAYLSGFIDGDGGISLQGTIYATNTHKGIIELLQKKFGGKIRHTINNNPNQQDFYDWNVSNKIEAKWIILQILPYLIDKKDKAKIALDKCDAKIQSKLLSNQESELTKTLVS